MEEEIQKINITSNRRTSDYGERMKNAWNSGNYSLHNQMENEHPFNKPSFYGDLDGKVRGGGHYGNNISQVISRISKLVEDSNLSDTPLVIESKRPEDWIRGGKIVRTVLEFDELKNIKRSLSEKFPSLNISIGS